MVSLTEALAAEGEKLQQDSADTQARREAGKEVSHTKVGSIGSWGVDPDLRLKFRDETTEWITIESVGRALDEAVAITARRMVDAEEQLKAGTNVHRFPEKTA